MDSLGSLQLCGDEFLLNAVSVVAGKTIGAVPLSFKSFTSLLAKFHDTSNALKAALWLAEHFATGKLGT